MSNFVGTLLLIFLHFFYFYPIFLLKLMKCQVFISYIGQHGKSVFSQHQIGAKFGTLGHLSSEI